MGGPWNSTYVSCDQYSNLNIWKTLKTTVVILILYVSQTLIKYGRTY